MARALVIVSDSGGIQEEAPSLGTRVICTRNTTERPEGVAAGVVRLVGTERERVREAVLGEIHRGQSLESKENPFGDGRAGYRIVEAIERAEGA